MEKILSYRHKLTNLINMNIIVLLCRTHLCYINFLYKPYHEYKSYSTVAHDQ